MKTKLILLFILLIPVTTVNGQEKKWGFGVNAALEEYLRIWDSPRAVIKPVSASTPFFRSGR